MLIDVPTAAEVVAVLPEPTSSLGQEVTIVKSDTTDYGYGVQISGTVQGIPGSSIWLIQSYSSVTLLATATGWQIIASNKINDFSINEFVIPNTMAFAFMGVIPLYTGNYLVAVYYRVTGSATDVSITITWTDATGAQSAQVVNVSAQAPGSYSAMLLVNTLAGNDGEIEASATCSSAGNVFCSASATHLS